VIWYIVDFETRDVMKTDDPRKLDKYYKCESCVIIDAQIEAFITETAEADIPEVE
jgi:hypothetical protein